MRWDKDHSVDQWRNKRGSRGDRLPPETSDLEILLTYREKKRQGKREKG